MFAVQLHSQVKSGALVWIVPLGESLVGNEAAALGVKLLKLKSPITVKGIAAKINKVITTAAFDEWVQLSTEERRLLKIF